MQISLKEQEAYCSHPPYSSKLPTAPQQKQPSFNPEGYGKKVELTSCSLINDSQTKNSHENPPNHHHKEKKTSLHANMVPTSGLEPATSPL